MRVLNFLVIIMIFSSSCRAYQRSTAAPPIAVLAYFEGTPRAHLPSVFWFSENTLLSISKDARYNDRFVQMRLERAPKFALVPDDYRSVVKLFLDASTNERSPYVVELFFAEAPPRVFFLNPSQFNNIKEQLKRKGIEGHEIFFDWPLPR